jgi:two-component sensor histidine kinase
MAANVLNSTRAIQVSLYVVRAFVRLRETLANHRDLAQKLDDLERKTESIAMKHDALASETQAKFREVIETLRQLMSSPTKRRPIGFIVSGPKE